MLGISISFLITIIDNVVCHYIIKWLNNNNKNDN